MSGGGIVLRERLGEDRRQELLSPTVGVFAPSLAEGALVSGGQVVGTIDVLGVLRELIVPEHVAGRIGVQAGGGRVRVPVQFGDVLLTVEAASVAQVPEVGPVASVGSGTVPSFVAPMSGRYYCRPSPNEPPFIAVGDTVCRGQTIGLLEVMKTFNRLVYEGDALPERATVEQIVPSDGDDVVRGEVILLLEPSIDG